MMTNTSELLNQFHKAIKSNEIEIIDLSHTLGPNTPMIKVPEGHGKNPPPVSLEYISNYTDDGGHSRWSTLTTAEHAGTHFDTPSHWTSGQDFVDGNTETIAVNRFLAPACVLDYSDEVKKDPDFILTKNDIIKWEDQHGSIEPGSWVLFQSGWSDRFNDPDKFLNMDEDGCHSPGPDPDAVKLMIERDVCGFGTETIGTDYGAASKFEPPFPLHYFMHGANKFGLASLTNLDKLPPMGSIIITPPLKIAMGSGSPLRVLALIPKL
jgi:kynurenine formamidase